MDEANSNGVVQILHSEKYLKQTNTTNKTVNDSVLSYSVFVFNFLYFSFFFVPCARLSF